MNTKVVYSCITSKATAISDGFKDLVACAPEGSHLILGPSLIGELGGKSFAHTFIPTSRNATLRILDLRWWRELWRLRKKSDNERLVLICYSTLPLNWLIHLLIRPDKSFVWSHDPVPHPDDSFFNSRIVPLDLTICHRVFRSVLLAGSSNVGKALLGRFPSAEIRILPFPFVRSIVDLVPVEKLSGERPTDVLFFGRMEEYKGLHVFVDALRQVGAMQKYAATELRVIVAGHGPLLAYMQGLAPIAGIDLKVSVKPSNAELASLIAQSKICCFPYLSATGTQTAQTALALGAKIVATDVGPFAEILRPFSQNRDYLMIPPSDPNALAVALAASLDETDRESAKVRAVRAREIFSTEAWSHAAFELASVLG